LRRIAGLDWRVSTELYEFFKDFMIFGLAVGGLALHAQDPTPPGTIAPSGQRLPPGTPSNPAVVPKLDNRGKAIYWWRTDPILRRASIS
jgi:hypothetical protein